MATVEELSEREMAWKQEMLLWRNKYESLEKKVEMTIAKGCSKTNESTKPKEACCDKVIKELETIKIDIQASNKGVANLEKKVNDWFQSINEKVEIDRQYSRKNNALLHGFKKLPDFRGAEFIRYIAEQLNYIFPSLSGTIYPCHIDDAHPLNTKKNGKTKVVIIKFVNRWIKDEIMKCKEDALNVGLSVTEHLTEIP